jgi:hypothetical protein
MQENYLVIFHLSNGSEKSENLSGISKQKIEQHLRLKYFDSALEVVSIKNI